MRLRRLAHLEVKSFSDGVPHRPTYRLGATRTYYMPIGIYDSCPLCQRVAVPPVKLDHIPTWCDACETFFLGVVEGRVLKEEWV